MKKMTERQVWLFLAKVCKNHNAVFHELRDDAGDPDGITDGLTVGLCWCLGTLHRNGYLQDKTKETMSDKIHAEVDRVGKSSYLGYMHGRNKAGYKKRAVFCRRMANKLKPKKRKDK